MILTSQFCGRYFRGYYFTCPSMMKTKWGAQQCTGSVHVDGVEFFCSCPCHTDPKKDKDAADAHRATDGRGEGG